MNSLEGPSMTMQEFHGAVLEVRDEDLHQGLVVILNPARGPCMIL